ncbi:hypothetical protein UFOVP1382_38 [uncultured Caudovirales phage]|uniref:Uncharacterized protein n=1 Tax=uncultured Caudovirales phage TaxID=2100421 RepID=A0A6J5S4F9_9CAUD|nr:hypothetical protein UFOVP1382_38 [uncultured Caudovirales phage]
MTAKPLNMYLLTRPPGRFEYDVTLSMVVAAPSVAAARKLQPQSPDTWIRPEDVVVKRIGIAIARRSRVLHTSFNAG